jgi:predicted nucleic acid-binding protein
LTEGAERVQVFVPEIADYELRRKLLHLIRKGQASRKSVERLEDLGKLLEYLPLDTETMRRAAALRA